MKVLSLFSGVGGFDVGLERAGMKTVFQCEWDKHANTILNKHWPDVPKWDDVSTLTGQHILSKAPVIDVVAWGSPCQDLSVAGKRAGLEGGRSNLFHEGIRIIKELRKETNGQYPRISIWENVVGALNSNGGADFGIILDQMAEAGALVIEWTVLDAQYFGVPQRRRRVFVIAIFDPAIAELCPDPLLPVCASLPGDIKKGKPARQSATTKTATGIGTDGQWWDGRDTAEALTTTNNEQRMPDKQRFQAIVERDVVGALAARDYKGVGNQYVAENKLVTEPFVKSSRAQSADDSETWVEGAINPTLNSFDQGDVRTTTAIVFENSYRDGARIANNGVTQTLSAKMGTGGGNTPMIAVSQEQPSETAWPTLRKEGSGHAVAIPIDTCNEVVGTLRSGGDGGVPSSRGEHLVTEPSMAVRRLTPLECERLMGWGDHHTRWKADGTEQVDTHRYKQCGNGVASPVAQWIAKHLLKI